MKHDIIRADVNLQKMDFLFECKYFDRNGALDKIKKFSSEIINSEENSQKDLPVSYTHLTLPTKA